MLGFWVVALVGCIHPEVILAPEPALSPLSDAVVAAMAHSWSTGCGAGGDVAACEAAVGESQWATRLAPNEPAVRRRFAAVLEGAGRVDEARFAWLAVLDRWPSDPEGWWGLGRTTPGAEGEAALRRAIDEGASGAAGALAARRLAAGDLAGAEAVLVGWAPVDPAGLRARVAVAAALERWDLVIADGAAALGPPAPDPAVALALLAAAAALCRPDLVALVRLVADPNAGDPRWQPYVGVTASGCVR